jgi:hypothetical protein
MGSLASTARPDAGFRSSFSRLPHNVDFNRATPYREPTAAWSRLLAGPVSFSVAGMVGACSEIEEIQRLR